MNNIFKNSKDIGDFGENLACRYLIKKDYQIVGRNIRFPLGEIDIVALKDGIYRIIEVKTVIHETPQYISRETNNTENMVIHETTSHFNPEDNVHYRKLSRLSVLSEMFMANNYLEEDFQVDVIAITLSIKEGIELSGNDVPKHKIDFFEAVI